MSRKKILSILACSQTVALKEYKAHIKGLFGSWARNSATAKSDIDILVEFAPGASLFDMMALADYLEGKLGNKVDLVSQRALRKELRPYVMKDLVVL